MERLATHGPELQHAYHEDFDYYEGRAFGLRASAEGGTEGAVAAFRRWGAPVSEKGARLVVARERLVSLLLERGADPARGNAHGWTPLHQAAYSNQVRLAQILLDADAPVDALGRGDGGTAAGRRALLGPPASRRAARRARCRPGQPARRRRAGPPGAPRPARFPEKGAWRRRRAPTAASTGLHSGFPAWKASDDSQEVLDEAFSWAARSDRADALDVLVARGADVDADVNRGTALTWAAVCRRTDAVRRLLALGADPNARTTFGGPEHSDGTTALHHAAETGHLGAIEALLDEGADPTVRDSLYDGTPANWAEYRGRHGSAKLLREGGV